MSICSAQRIKARVADLESLPRYEIDTIWLPCHRFFVALDPTVQCHVRRKMRHQLFAGLCFAVVIALIAGDNGYNVEYDGGTLSDTKAGAELKMYIEAYQVRFVKDNSELAKIPASAITEIRYGQDVQRRITAVALAWSNGDQKDGLAVQCNRTDYRGILAGLEGISGKKAVHSESTQNR